MAMYAFITDDGEEIDRQFKMGECPREIVLDDGRTARRTYSCNISMFGGGHASGDGARKLNADMKRRQDEAGRRMRDNWQSVK